MTLARTLCAAVACFSPLVGAFAQTAQADFMNQLQNQTQMQAEQQRRYDNNQRYLQQQRDQLNQCTNCGNNSAGGNVSGWYVPNYQAQSNAAAGIASALIYQMQQQRQQQEELEYDMRREAAHSKCIREVLDPMIWELHRQGASHAQVNAAIDGVCSYNSLGFRNKP